MTHKNKWVEEKIFEIEQILTECFDNDKYLWSVADKKLTSLIHSKVTQTQQETLEWCLKKVVGEDDTLYLANPRYNEARNILRNKMRQIIKNKMENK